MIVKAKPSLLTATRRIRRFPSPRGPATLSGASGRELERISSATTCFLVADSHTEPLNKKGRVGCGYRQPNPTPRLQGSQNRAVYCRPFALVIAMACCSSRCYLSLSRRRTLRWRASTQGSRAQLQPTPRPCLHGLHAPSYSFSNISFSAPHSGQTQSSGRSSKGVPGATPLSGSPSAGS